MYKLYLKSIAVAFFAVCLLTSCQKSIRGKWTNADKASFSKKLSKKTDEIFKTVTKTFDMNVTDIKAISDCSLAKIEAAYTPTEAMTATKEIEELITGCYLTTLLEKTFGNINLKK